MKYTNYTPDTIKQLGYSVLNNQIVPFQGKINITLVDENNKSINVISLRQKDMPSIAMPTEPQPFPKNWSIVYGQAENSGEQSRWFLAIMRSEVKKLDALPVRIGDSIHIKSKNGIYQVAYCNRDIVIITSKVWGREYNKGLRESPIEIILWDDYKCKQGTTDLE